MTLLEELNSENLSKRASEALHSLEHEIDKLKNGNKRNPPTIEGNKKLKALVEDYQEFVQKIRDYLKTNNLDPAAMASANKAIGDWKYIYSKLKEYNSLVLNYNENNSPKLETIEKRTGFEIKESVKYFEY